LNRPWMLDVAMERESRCHFCETDLRHSEMMVLCSCHGQGTSVSPCSKNDGKPGLRSNSSFYNDALSPFTCMFCWFMDALLTSNNIEGNYKMRDVYWCCDLVPPLPGFGCHESWTKSHSNSLYTLPCNWPQQVNS
jgi:hypothetical protein